MEIAILGTGNVGAALATGWARAGHRIRLGTRRPGDPALAPLLGATGAAAMPAASAVAGADAIALALPWAAVPAALADLGDLAGRVLIDCTNPLGMVDAQLGLLIGHSDSGGEEVQALVPAACVVKTLNQVGAEMMADNAGLPHRPVMFMAGNDDAAKALVAGLLTDLGFDPLDAGPIGVSRLLEPFGMMWIHQALLRGKGRNWAFAAVAAA
jgi:predicted dinucleotide-binding enzyme